jgi:hypothetical protein
MQTSPLAGTEKAATDRRPAWKVIAGTVAGWVMTLPAIV